MTPYEEQRHLDELEHSSLDSLKIHRTLIGLELAHKIYGTRTIPELKKLWTDVNSRVKNFSAASAPGADGGGTVNDGLNIDLSDVLGP